MLTLAVENPEAASSNIFNCVSDRAVTLDGMAKLCAQAADLPVEILHYDPKAIGADAKKAFPFLNMGVRLFAVKEKPLTYSMKCNFCTLGTRDNSFYPWTVQHSMQSQEQPRTSLGWRITTHLPQDLERCDEYIKMGRDKKAMEFETDDKILEHLKFQ